MADGQPELEGLDVETRGDAGGGKEPNGATPARKGSGVAEDEQKMRALVAALPPDSESTHLAPGEERLVLVDLSTAVLNAPKFAVGDHVMGMFQNQSWYPGTLSDAHEDGTFTMNYDDGDVERLPLERLRTHDEHQAAQPNDRRNRAAAPNAQQDKLSSLDGYDGVQIKCSVACRRQFSMAHIFDFRHGRLLAEDQKNDPATANDWRVPLPKDKDVKLTVTFGRPRFISRVKLFARPFNWKEATSNFLLTAVPCSSSGLSAKPIILTPEAVDCRHDKDGDFHEFDISRGLDSIIVTIKAVPSKSFATLAGLDIYGIARKDAALVDASASTFTTDFASMINNPIFHDCVLRVEGRDICAHKCILCGRSEYFHNMFKSPLAFKEQMDEKGHMPIEINDVSYTSFMNVLKYIYTDHIRDVQSIDDAVELWRLADRFQLGYLKLLAEQYLENNMDCMAAMRICQTPSIALYDGLHNRVVSVIARNFEQAMDLEEFANLPKHLLHLVLKQVKTAKAVEDLMRT